MHQVLSVCLFGARGGGAIGRSPHCAPQPAPSFICRQSGHQCVCRSTFQSAQRLFCCPKSRPHLIARPPLGPSLFCMCCVVVTSRIAFILPGWLVMRPLAGSCLVVRPPCRATAPASPPAARQSGPVLAPSLSSRRSAQTPCVPPCLFPWRICHRHCLQTARRPPFLYASSLPSQAPHHFSPALSFSPPSASSTRRRRASPSTVCSKSRRGWQ